MDLSTRLGRREQGQRIQQAVERAGLSIEELAGRIGCSRALLYQYLSGSTLAQPDRLQQIATQCGLPLTYFYADNVADTEATFDAPSLAPTSEPSAAETVPSEPPVTPLFPAPPAPAEVAARLSDSLRALQEPADAQESPPDYRSLASTCERILSLSSQLGDRASQARAQRELGNALLRTADYPRAVDALMRAVTLAEETKDVAGEMGGRQSLGVALHQMGRTEEAREQFARIANGPLFVGRWQGTVSLGGIHEHQGEYQQAMERFDEAASILEEAEANGTASAREVAVGLLYVNANRANVYMDGGDFAEARPLAAKCLADAESLGSADQHLEARFNLAWCDFYTGQWASAHHGLATMLQLARFVGDQGRATLAQAWLGIYFAAAGDYNTAIGYGKDALSLALSRGDRRSELYAQLALADAYIAAGGRDSEARYHANQALTITTSSKYARSEVECRLRLARLAAQTGELGELRDAATRACMLAQRLGARHLESLARGWLAEAHLRTYQAQSGQIVSSGSSPESADRSAQSEEASAQQAAEPQSERISDPTLTLARTEANRALEMARDTGYGEATWRAEFILARIDLAEQALPTVASAVPDSAEIRLRAAIDRLEALRASLIQAGIPDALLENQDCIAVYERLAEFLTQRGRSEEAAAFLEQTGWPPLTMRMARSSRAHPTQP